ncbi:MAG: Ppx/GppA phosphatase family protein [Acidimicrobiales bacterium]
MSAGPVAVVDLGSGACKLLVADHGWLAGGPALLRTAQKTRLLPEVGDRITESALATTAETFDRFVADMAEHQPTRVSVIGTAWARTVSNLEVLEALVADKFGVELEVITGEREAELGFRGATSGREVDDPTLVVDVGAGSTEFGFRNLDGSLATVSLPIGGGTVMRDYLVSDPPQASELSSALTVVALHLDDLKREIPEIARVDFGTVLGTGATCQIAEVEIGLPDPDAESVDGYHMKKVDLEDVFRALATESAADRAFNPGLRAQDVDDIVGAMCVLVELARQFALDEIVVAERGVSAGLAVELLDEG